MMHVYVYTPRQDSATHVIVVSAASKDNAMAIIRYQCELENLPLNDVDVIELQERELYHAKIEGK